jgi:hypothetical protein
MLKIGLKCMDDCMGFSFLVVETAGVMSDIIQIYTTFGLKAGELLETNHPPAPDRERSAQAAGPERLNPSRHIEGITVTIRTK